MQTFLQGPHPLGCSLLTRMYGSSQVLVVRGGFQVHGAQGQAGGPASANAPLAALLTAWKVQWQNISDRVRGWVLSEGPLQVQGPVWPNWFQASPDWEVFLGGVVWWTHGGAWISRECLTPSLLLLPCSMTKAPHGGCTPPTCKAELPAWHDLVKTGLYITGAPPCV